MEQESVCFINTFYDEECHKNSYGEVAKEIVLVSGLSEEYQHLLRLRICNEINTICKYHLRKYIDKYVHIFGQKCCDPFQIHKKSIQKSLREITMQHVLSNQNSANKINLVPGKSVCTNCFTKLFSNDNTEDINPDRLYEPAGAIIEQLDATCSILGLSPASKVRKLSNEKRAIALQSKVERVSSKIKRNLEIGFSTAIPDVNQTLTNKEPLAEEYASLINELKEKCKIASKEEKVRIISLMPKSWPRWRVATELGVSERLTKITNELVKEQGVLPDLGKRKGVSVIDETINKVIAFYEDESNSRICPGKKDCVSVIVNGQKTHKQKRLMLVNLNELFVLFKKENPDCKIGRSKFCQLRPKWCILAGASGTHNVCVCPYHQNVKLMIDGAKLAVDYKDLIDLIVCNSENYSCMVGKCEECPGKEVLTDVFSSSDEYELMPDEITYKKWIVADRADMINVVETKDDFFENLANKIESLKTHHFVAKTQGAFFKTQKESLKENECLVIGDFSENFSFLIQDEIQSFHWVNKQVTVHPFVMYFKEDDKIVHSSICILSDHLQHDTATVHAFQRHLIKFIKETRPSVTKLIYFTDGSSSQYKNKKNFANVCSHQTDFQLDAEWNFFASAHGKNACDGIGGTTKREVTKASLQRPFGEQILTIDDMYKFCTENLKAIKFILVSKDEVVSNHEILKSRFESCHRIVGTRSYHRFVPISEGIIRCYIVSNSNTFEDHSVYKLSPITLTTKELVACVYEEQWWIGEVIDISRENKDVFVHFFHPSGPRTSFKKSLNDTVWVPMDSVLRKLTPLELSTQTGRSHTISKKLSEEISKLLMKWKPK